MVLEQEWPLKVEDKFSIVEERKEELVYPRKKRPWVSLEKIEYQAIFNQSNKIRTTLFTILFKTNQKDRRLGIIIPKKKVKLSTNRNTLRRKIKEFFRINRHELPVVHVIFGCPSAIFLYLVCKLE